MNNSRFISNSTPQSPALETVVAQVSLRVGTPEESRIVPPGTPVAMVKEEAARLRQRHLLRESASAATQTSMSSVEAPSVPSTLPNATDGADHADRIDAIVDAIADLAPEARTKDGKPHKPTVRAVAEILGDEVGAQERDQAWDQYQALVADAVVTDTV